mgnify:CR=1 FL=1
MEIITEDFLIDCMCEDNTYYVEDFLYSGNYTIDYVDFDFENLLVIAACNYGFEVVELLIKDKRNNLKQQAEELFSAVLENESSCLFRILIKNIDFFNYAYNNINKIKNNKYIEEDEQKEIIKIFNESNFKKMKDKINNF